MAGQFALLFVWLSGLFILVGAVTISTASFIANDSREYDEQYIWLRKLDE